MGGSDACDEASDVTISMSSSLTKVPNDSVASRNRSGKRKKEICKYEAYSVRQHIPPGPQQPSFSDC